MPGLCLRFYLASVLALPTCPGGVGQSRPQRAAPAAAEDSHKMFLQEYLSPPRPRADRTTRYLDAFVDLDGDGIEEAIVYLTGQRWCGSGGCTTLILARQGSSYRLVTKITIAWPPVRVLTSSTDGWRDLAVRVQGGGLDSGYEAEVRFDGRTYPTNPSTPPARRLAARTAGTIVVPSSQEGKPLYP